MIPTVVVSLKYVEMRNWVVDILKGRFKKIKVIVVPSISRRDVTTNLKHWDRRSTLLVIMDVPQLVTELDWVAWRKRLPLKASMMYLGPASSGGHYVVLEEEVLIQSIKHSLGMGIHMSRT